MLAVLVLALFGLFSGERVVAAPPDSGVRIYLITIGPGDEVWEQFGHNAIEIVDPSRKYSDVACNWGVFDNFEKGFYTRFIFGRMLYRMEMDGDAQKMIEYYRQSNRSVYRQELNLTESQKAALQDYVYWNAQPENQNYRYDYYRDNCSTRARDVIDRSVGGELAAQLKPKKTGVTYRWHTRRIMASDLPMYTSLLFILGHPVDRPISAWEDSFLPLRLMDYLRHVTVVDDLGNRVPIVKSEEVLFKATREAQRAKPPNWVVPFFVLGLLCAGIFWVLGKWAVRSRLGRGIFLTVAAIWGIFIGGAGTFALWGWMCTEHVAVYWNENILHFFPPAILLGILIPVAAKYPTRRTITVIRWLAIGVAVCSVFGLLIKVLPWFRQVNYELIAWVLPTHLAFAWGICKVYQLRKNDISSVA